MIENYDNSAESLEIIEDIINLRTSFLLTRVLEGLHLDFDRALDMVRNNNNAVSLYEREQREVLLAAIDNLIDFAVAQEYTMLSELPEEATIADFEIYEPVFSKYNLQYTSQENEDVLHASLVAYWWLSVSQDSLVTFMTQSDERVRPWHLSFEGISYPKREFPQELIPPIEHGCRCFLISDSPGVVMNSIKETEDIKQINPVFKESLATGGRIFSEKHSYFKKKLPKQLEQIKERIKQKILFDTHGN